MSEFLVYFLILWAIFGLFLRAVFISASNALRVSEPRYYFWAFWRNTPAARARYRAKMPR